MKILHLSDLHFTADDQVNQPLVDRLTFVANNYREHFIVITGDIIDGEGAVVPGTQLPVPGGINGVPEIIPSLLTNLPPLTGPLVSPHLDQFQAALTAALNALQLLPQGKVIVCAGNHDYGLWGNIYFSNLPQLFDDMLYTPLMNRGGPQDGSTLTAASLFADQELLLSAQKPILYSVSDGTIGVSLVSVNTAFIDATNIPSATFATGMVGGAQITALQNNGGFNPQLPANLLPTIVMMHHHPFTHGPSSFVTRLNDADTFMPVVRNRADLIMFGHQHVEKRFEPGDVPFGGFRAGALAAGSSRVETGAWEISIDPDPSGATPAIYSFTRQPIL
ncbi:metallophosphoesterase family protein [Paraburkholderia terrae]|uniref:metallophosphoesterase family protein n=1 Tax=Paraburkholderia terrae TaxID=311230 RepID=UPI00296B4EB9|nr:metallophosphoesterase [Paraburkholderia terrae]MDW3663755.1 metallophosphoesterase [Paraburkholderia terrae]